MFHWSDFMNFGIALFALLNPFTKIPFILTSSHKNTKAVLIFAVGSTATVILVLVGAHFIGVAALKVLGTTLPSFQIGGGIVLLLTGLNMLFSSIGGKSSEIDDSTFEKTRYVGLAVSPLGIPMLAGPGAITKVIVDAHPGTGMEEELHTIVIIVLVAVACGAVVAASQLLARFLGNGFFAVMGRLAGLIIVAVGIEMMVKGIISHINIFVG